MINQQNIIHNLSKPQSSIVRHQIFITSLSIGDYFHSELISFTITYFLVDVHRRVIDRKHSANVAIISWFISLSFATKLKLLLVCIKIQPLKCNNHQDFFHFVELVGTLSIILGAPNIAPKRDHRSACINILIIPYRLRVQEIHFYKR